MSMVNATTLDEVRIEVVGEARAVRMPGAMWVDFRDKLPAFIGEVETALEQLDHLAAVWGDEGVFRRARDRLRGAIKDARIFTGEQPT